MSVHDKSDIFGMCPSCPTHSLCHLLESNFHSATLLLAEILNNSLVNSENGDNDKISILRIGKVNSSPDSMS